ncbi:PREDICTED: uncharacterized protein LOC108762315 [Trachymyrmex cornetzi]|uniref:uncharacterized protein LOC108762315 n=1 Tax=Trachymyrmex cornetzi TaxID=471704 RepID=UPI00084F3F98|nr:PREDICTED: uncharacterized protein LOC108762315 [Trachymyrmex cornetzi]
MDILSTKWCYIERNTELPKSEFFKALKLVLSSSYFTFNDKFYKQTFGVPMGSPLSPIVADIVMQELESISIRKLATTPTFYVRYVDDILLITESSDYSEILDTFNDYHPRLKFTMEEGGDTINFLDVTLIKEGRHIITDWYRKTTFSGRFLNFYSCHPISQKVGTILGLIDKVILLSHPRFHRENFNKIISILLKNGYPLRLIFSTIKKRLQKKFQQLNNRNTSTDPVLSSEDRRYFTIPYIPSITDKIKNFIRGIPGLKLAYRGIQKLNAFIRVQKDKLPTTSQAEVVYRLDCRDCDASYVGQTGRCVGVRMSEHKNHINRNTSQSSVITDHRLQTSHDFDWDNVKILDKEMFWNKRLLSEMIHIKRQKKGLNLQNNTLKLDPLYESLFSVS